MSLSHNRKLILAWKALLFLMLINYQVIVVLCNDFLPLKFARDFLLLYILVQTFYCRPGIVRTYLPALLLLCLCLFAASLRTKGLGTLFINLRKYLFPVGVVIAARMFPYSQKQTYLAFLRFCANLTAVLAVYGIFQAHILGDSFLINMGYPTMYSYAYKRVTLNYSFYFGNLGIQRVTATLSNSNVFGIVLGVMLIVILINHKHLLKRTMHWVRLAAIALGYLLTVSRSNFLAMAIVALLLFWKYIPYKKQIILAAIASVIVFFLIYWKQDANGITHKLVKWVVESLSLTESSAAGRDDFWTVAWNKVITTPLGIGFGHTGTQASNQGTGFFCENSYLAMALDMGWLGCISFVAFAFSLIYDAQTIPPFSQFRPFKKQIATVVIYFMIVCFFSNHIYDMEAVSFVYFLVGISSNHIEHCCTLDINTQTLDKSSLETSS